jgi:hypothetical protein
MPWYTAQLFDPRLSRATVTHHCMRTGRMSAGLGKSSVSCTRPCGTRHFPVVQGRATGSCQTTGGRSQWSTEDRHWRRVPAPAEQ